MEDKMKSKLRLLKWYKKPVTFYQDIFDEDPYKYQKKVLENITDFNITRIMMLAAGGTGKTKLMGALALWHGLVYSYFNGRYDVVIISGSEPQARILYTYALEGINRSKTLQGLILGELLQSKITTKNYSLIMPVANSLKSIQGKHCPLVIIDEAVLAGDFLIRDAFRIIGPYEDNRLIVGGTPMEYASLFVDMWLNKDDYPEYDHITHEGWKRYNWSAAECPSISEKARLEAKRNLPDDMYEIFWEGKPFVSMLTLIPYKQIMRASKDVPMFSYHEGLGETQMGIDWGFKDPTVMTISQLVEGAYRIIYQDAWKREQFSDLHQRIYQAYREFNVQRVYADSSHEGENQRLADLGINVTRIKFRSTRQPLQARLKALFNTSKILIPDEFHDMLYQIKKYTWDTHTKDDYVDSLMLSVWRDFQDSGPLFWEVITPKKQF